MIPLRDQNPTKKTAIVNRLLIVANILVWIYVLTLVRQPSAVEAFYDQYSFDWTDFVTQISQGHAVAPRDREHGVPLDLRR